MVSEGEFRERRRRISYKSQDRGISGSHGYYVQPQSRKTVLLALSNQGDRNINLNAINDFAATEAKWVPEHYQFRNNEYFSATDGATGSIFLTAMSTITNKIVFSAGAARAGVTDMLDRVFAVLEVRKMALGKKRCVKAQSHAKMIVIPEVVIMPKLADHFVRALLEDLTLGLASDRQSNSPLAQEEGSISSFPRSTFGRHVRPCVEVSKEKPTELTLSLSKRKGTTLNPHTGILVYTVGTITGMGTDKPDGIQL
ncbi:hypothetical protein DFH06DRAFT_1140535 [Mycena polygramma]|nr:hypothetical protein DFH06DRAFT_1140535 [Mycena polygramma]